MNKKIKKTLETTSAVVTMTDRHFFCNSPVSRIYYEGMIRHRLMNVLTVS